VNQDLLGFPSTKETPDAAANLKVTGFESGGYGVAAAMEMDATCVDLLPDKRLDAQDADVQPAVATEVVEGDSTMVSAHLPSFFLIVPIVLALVVLVSWYTAQRRRVNVRERLQQLVALKEDGLLSEQNYLAREREILQEI